jgi:hypothetical protein
MLLEYEWRRNRRDTGDRDHHQRHRPKSIIAAAKDGVPARMQDRGEDDASKDQWGHILRSPLKPFWRSQSELIPRGLAARALDFSFVLPRRLACRCLVRPFALKVVR